MRLTKSMLTVFAAFSIAGSAFAQSEIETVTRRALDYHGQYPAVPLSVEGSVSFSQEVVGDNVVITINCSFDYAFSDTDGLLTVTNPDPADGSAAQACSALRPLVRQTKAVLASRENLAELLASADQEQWAKVEGAPGTLTYEVLVADLTVSMEPGDPGEEAMEDIEGFDGRFVMRLSFDEEVGYLKHWKVSSGPVLLISGDYRLLDNGRPVLDLMTFKLDAKDKQSGFRIQQTMSLDIKKVEEVESRADSGEEIAALFPVMRSMLPAPQRNYEKIRSLLTTPVQAVAPVFPSLSGKAMSAKAKKQ